MRLRVLWRREYDERGGFPFEPIPIRFTSVPADFELALESSVLPNGATLQMSVDPDACCVGATDPRSTSAMSAGAG